MLAPLHARAYEASIDVTNRAAKGVLVIVMLHDGNRTIPHVVDCLRKGGRITKRLEWRSPFAAVRAVGYDSAICAGTVTFEREVPFTSAPLAVDRGVDGYTFGPMP